MLQRVMQSLPRLFELAAITSKPEWMAIRDRSLRRMRLVIPLMYTGIHFTRHGWRRGWKTARALVHEFPDVGRNVLYWPAVVTLSLIPRSPYDAIKRYYSRHSWPKRLLNVIGGW
jgi:hypothetical protein